MVTNNAINVATAASNTVLQGQGVGTTPAFSTATYPATTTINQILYSSSANTVAGLATANNGVLTTGTTGIPVVTALGTNGQLIIGSGSGAPAAATLTAGTGITITNAANSITIASSGGSSPSGTVLGEARATLTTPTSSSLVLAQTGATPTTGTTTLAMSVTYTPTSATSTIHLKACFSWCTSTGVSRAGAFLFSGSTLVGAFPLLDSTAGTDGDTSTIETYFTSGTTSSTSYALYYAPGSLGSMYLLQTSGATQYYNGTSDAYLIVTEVVT
jgi:hypothetical protein